MDGTKVLRSFLISVRHLNLLFRVDSAFSSNSSAYVSDRIVISVLVLMQLSRIVTLTANDLIINLYKRLRDGEK